MFAACVAALSLFLQGCEKEKNEIPALDVPSSVSLPVSGQKQVLAIKANCNWEIVCKAGWLTFSDKQGSGDKNVEVSATVNDSVGLRSVKAEVVYEGQKKEVTIEQAGADPVLTVTGDMEFPAAGAEKTLVVKANGDWEIVCDALWPEFTPAKGHGDGEVTVKVPSYLSLDGRDVTAEIQYGGQKKEIPITQLAVEATSLTGKGTANCYLVDGGAGAYVIEAVNKGNSATDKIGAWSKAGLLWQDTKGLVSSVDFNSEESLILVNVSSGTGNAVVYVCDDKDAILWSWHLWVADYDPDKTAFVTPESYGDGSRWTFMDRHLGATTAKPGDIDALGLLYQWGRKDPFTASGAFTDEERPIYDIDGNELGGFEKNTAKNGTLELSVAHPDVFYAVSYPTGDWCDKSDDDFWGGVSGSKTVYDPCPVGWKVPVSDAAGVTPYGFLNRNNATWVDNGRLFNDTDWWLAAAGTRVLETGGVSIDINGPYGGIWTGSAGKASSDPEYPALYGQYFMVMSGKRTVMMSKDSRSQGMSVRCVKE